MFALAAAGAAWASIAFGQADPDPGDWPAVERAARGQTVYWHAWAGSTRANDFIAWAGRQVAARHGVRVEHVKLADTAEAVSRVVAERAAGRDTDGAVDLIWINGENFSALKTRELLFGPWARSLPNWRYVDAGPPVTTDFGTPTDGLEAPWGLARFVFYHDAARLPAPPRTMAALLAWARANPGRFAIPQPPDFLGSTFLKQALAELTAHPAALAAPVEAADSDAVTRPLWTFLERLTPRLWRSGRAYPQTGARLIQLMADGEIDLAVTFNPSEAAAAIANFELPDTVRTYAPAGGSIANASFVAIPYNATAKAGALVLANFLLSPEAQAHKQDINVWGNDTVLDLDRLRPADRARFDRLETGPAQLPTTARGRTRAEPHPSWTVRLENEWTRRFGVTR